MSFNKMSKTEIVMIVFAILFIIEEIITNIDYMFFIAAPILLVSLLLFIINVFKRIGYAFRSEEEQDDNIRCNILDNIMKYGLLTIQMLVYTLYHLIVCSCGHFIINVIPFAICFLVMIVLYNKFIKNEIKENKLSGEKIAFIFFVYIISLIAAGVIGDYTYIHDTDILIEEGE